jgi:SAM-dependent MidA family methyltransferase
MHVQGTSNSNYVMVLGMAPAIITSPIDFHHLPAAHHEVKLNTHTYIHQRTGLLSQEVAVMGKTLP